MCDDKIIHSPNDSKHLARHFQVNENHSTPLERLGAFMAAQSIDEEIIAGDIETSKEAIQYIKQKMRSAEHWHSVNKWTARVAGAAIAAGISIPIGLATAGLGTVAAALLAGAAASGVAAISQDIVQSKLHKFALQHDWKLNPLRGIKALHKLRKGTKGKHRNQAATVLVDNAKSYIDSGRPQSLNNDFIRNAFLAYKALSIVYGDDVTLDNVFRDNEESNIKEMVAELLRS